MPPITFEEAAGLTRTGDVWLFRGRTPADRAIQVATNSPVNHVGMSVVLEELPPLMWHAELGRSLPDLWSGTRQRGTYQAMGLLSGRHRTSWYDAGRFWSGDDLRLSGGYRLSGEVAVTI